MAAGLVELATFAQPARSVAVEADVFTITRPNSANSAAAVPPMKRTTLILLKTLTWIACLCPMALLVYQAVTNTLGPDPTSNITLTTGYNTLLLLIISLAITPVRKLSPHLAGSSNFAACSASSLSSTHSCTCSPISRSTRTSICAPCKTDITKRRFITAASLHICCCFRSRSPQPTWAIRKLGGKHWNRLHKLVYLAAICGIIHYWWQVKPAC